MKLKTNLLIALYVVALMLCCLCSSPLVDQMNTDSAVFIAMGRGMAAGKIMYKELFDHKGLYIYFLNYIAALISSNSQIGLFIVECAFIFVCAKAVHASFSLYTNEKVHG